MSDNMLNRQVGRYEIKELIGEGAMAMVYRAYDPEINRSVACKILKTDHCVDDEYMSRFLREAKAAGSLSHTSIVTVFDVGKVDDSPYIMMELLKGKDLNEVLKEKKTLSINQTLTIALQLAKALNYAHSVGIVHRDIKPDNIIVFPDGETIKVADFGIARMNENEEAQKTQIGAVLGTPRYMSPEQALGQEVDGRSDLFSVGVIMYEMLTGIKAFDASNMGTLMIQIAQQQPKPLKKLKPEVSAGLRQIVQKLLQKSPDKRFQSGDDLANALIKEIGAMRDQSEEQKKHKYVPLKIKWTLAAVAVVATVMLISMNVVFGLQSTAMTKQAVDSGSSFAKFIATETAIPLLSEDWITLEIFINDAASRDTFAYLIVTDRTGLIRGASDISLVGQLYQESEDAELVSKVQDVYTTSSTMDNDTDVFNIATPIYFQNVEVGSIILGLSQQSLDEVKGVTGWLMFLLAIITISSVALVMFILGGLISKPLKTITYALNSFASGDLDVRISQTRLDEIGEVFSDFNNMASAIQKRYTSVSDELAQSAIHLPTATLESSAVNHPVDEAVEDATIMASSLIAVKDQPADDRTIIATHNNQPTAPAASTPQVHCNDQSTAAKDDAIANKLEQGLKKETKQKKRKATKIVKKIRRTEMVKIAKTMLIVLVYLVVNGCANQSDNDRRIAKNNNFDIVQLKQFDTYASLAQKYLGGAKYASILKRYNPDIKLSTARYIAIPRGVLNRTSVFTNGFQQVPILCYHQFTELKNSPSKMTVTQHAFSEQMAYLHDNGYTVITLSDVGKFVRGNKELPSKAVVITIDDGYRSYMDVALPILKRYQFPSTMFIYPEFVGAGIALKWHDVKALHKDPLVDIQNHSKTHDSLFRRPFGESDENYSKRLNSEVLEAQGIIRKRTGKLIDQFAYPYGNSSARVVHLLKENDYDLAVTVERGSNPAFSAPYMLNRTMIYGGDSLQTFKRSLDTFSAMDLK